MLTSWPILIPAGLAFILFILAVTTLSNCFAFPRLGYSRRDIEGNQRLETGPTLSILIPARNEASTIEETLRALLTQDTAACELLVLNDRSTDDTAARVANLAAADPRLRLLDGEPLPAGWLGKNWACAQLGREARGELLLFADADVRWGPGSLTTLLEHQAETGAGLLTVWPTQRTGSWGEWLVVPLMKFAIMAYLPLIGVHHLPWSPFAAANGQCLLFRREVYERIGGHAAVRGDIVEDVALARRVKRCGGRLRMADGGGLISCHMYDGWTAVKRGFGKNILAGHGNSVLFLLISTAFHWTVFVLPWLWLLIDPGWAMAGLAAGFTGVRWLADWYVDRRPLVALGRALLMPVSVALMTRVALQSLTWHFGSGPEWKGRRIGGTGSGG